MKFRMHLITGKILETPVAEGKAWEKFLRNEEEWKDLVKDNDAVFTIFTEHKRIFIPCRNILYLEAVNEEQF